MNHKIHGKFHKTQLIICMLLKKKNLILNTCLNIPFFIMNSFNKKFIIYYDFPNFYSFILKS